MGNGSIASYSLRRSVPEFAPTPLYPTDLRGPPCIICKGYSGHPELRVGYSRDTFLADGFGRRYLWIDVVNSMHWDGRGKVTDHLSDASWVRACLIHWGLEPWATRGRRKATRELREARSVLRPLATNWTTSHLIPADGLRAVNAALRVPVHRTFSGHPGEWHLTISPSQTAVDWVRMAALESFAKTFAEDDPQRLKVCPNAECRWVFFDETARNIRKWCRDAACGNRDRVRRSRLRARS